MTVPFVHLHCHSHYSFYNGLASPCDLIEKAKEFGMPAIALTDLYNLHGVPEFCAAAKRSGIKPILGCEIRVAMMDQEIENAVVDHLTLLSMNKEGWQNLLRLFSLAYRNAAQAGSLIDKEWLRKHNAGLICLSGFASGELARQLAMGKSGYAHAKSTADWFLDVFGDRYYLELRNHGIKEQKTLLKQKVRIGKELGIPTVATHDIHSLEKDDWKIYEMLLCLKEDKLISDADRTRMNSRRHYFRTTEEMYEAFSDNREAVERAAEISERVEPDILSDFYSQKHHPVFPLPVAKSADELLRDRCLVGLEKRYSDSPVIDEAKQRLEAELAVIQERGFANEFLIFGDMARFLEERTIPHTARGPAVGSIVGYVLSLSHECPIKNGLYFERFIDTHRPHSPLIYVDIDSAGHTEIVDYLNERYGKGNISETVHFDRMSQRESIRSTARVFNLPIHYAVSEAREFSDLVWWRSATELDKFCAGDAGAIEGKESLYRRYRSDSKLRKLFDSARHFEGLPLGFSKGEPKFCTATAWIPADAPIDELLPVFRIEGANEMSVQWEKDDIDGIAEFFQLNVCEMRDLTTLSHVVNRIQVTRGIAIDPYRLPLDDRKTFEMIGRGDVSGIYLFDSDWYDNGDVMMELLRRLKPGCLQDIAAARAICRPGLLEMGIVDQYVEAKNGRQNIDCIHPKLEEILSETYGIVVYQEQVMEILNRIGGIPLDDAYTIIKDIAKRKENHINRARQRFLDGAKANGCEYEQAAKIFDLVAQFASYGFNKSHAVAHARIAYMTAFLKAHYPDEFTLFDCR